MQQCKEELEIQQLHLDVWMIQFMLSFISIKRVKFIS